MADDAAGVGARGRSALTVPSASHHAAASALPRGRTSGCAKTLDLHEAAHSNDRSREPASDEDIVREYGSFDDPEW